MNIFDSCMQGQGNEPAIIYKSNTGDICRQSYEELNVQCNMVANGLQELGLGKGDTVAIDMIMTVESVAIYLGILKAGCVAVSIADSLAPKEIQKRLEISKAKVLFTQDVILRGRKVLPLYDKILEVAPDRVIVLPIKGSVQVNIRTQDILWENFLSVNSEFESVACDPLDPANILFSSGTTKLSTFFGGLAYMK